MANTIFQDHFTEASDTALASHAPDVGTGWSIVWQTGGTSKITVIGSTDRAKADATVANSGVVYSADATYGTADYEASCVVAAGFTGSNRGYLIVRMQDQENMYALRFSTGASATRLYKKVSGTWTALGSFQADPAVGDTIKIRISGTTLTFYYNGTLKDTQTVSDISAAGKAGFGMGGGAELAASTDDILSTSAIDDFLVQDLVTGPAAPSSLSGSENSGDVDLTWTDNSGDETGFVLERKRGSSPNYYQIATPAANATSYTDTDVDPGYTYTYRIKAVNGSGESAYATSSPVAMSGTKKWTSHIQGWIYPGQSDAQTELIDGRILYSAKPEYGTLNSSGVYSEPTGSINMIDDANITPRSLAYSNKPYFTVSANAAGVAAIGADSTKQTNCINAIISTLQNTNFAGVELDWEGFGTWSSTTYGQYKSFVEDLCTAVHAIGKKVIICGPPIGDVTEQGYYEWKYEDFESSAVDFVEPLAYDWDFDFGAGTAIAPITRVQNVCLWTRDKISDISRIIIGQPSYGYYGATGGFTITNITEEQAKLRTGYSGRSALSGSNESIFASGGESTVFVEQAGMNAHREMIEDEGIKYISVWHLGDNPWFSGKSELDTLQSTAVVAPILAAFSVQGVTASSGNTATADVSPIMVAFTLPAVTATHHSQASVDPINAAFSLPAVAADYDEVYSAGAAPVLAAFVLPDVTGTHRSTASVDPVLAAFSVQAAVATYLEHDTADVAPILAQFTLPAVAASYNQVNTANVAPVLAAFSVQDVTAVYAGVYAANMAPLESLFDLPTVSAAGGDTAGTAPVLAAFTLLDVEATHHSEADMLPILAQFTLPDVTATHHSAAQVAPVLAALTLPDVTATHHSQAAVDVLQALFTTPAVAASYDQIEIADVETLLALFEVHDATASHHAAGQSDPIAALFGLPEVEATFSVAPSRRGGFWLLLNRQ